MTDEDQTSNPREPDTASRNRLRRPSLIVFDVNETLSDMSPMAERFTDVGAPAHLAKVWFAGVLRDGFSLTAVGVNESFAAIAAEGLRVVFDGQALDRSIEDAVQHVMDGFAGLPVHLDVPDGIRLLADASTQLVTPSNGSTSVAEALFDRAGIRGYFEALLSVEDAPCGNRQRRRTPMHSSGARWNLVTRCWSPSTRGTSTVRRVLVWPRPGSTVVVAITPTTSGLPISPSNH